MNHLESRGLTSVASDFMLFHHKVKSCSAALWICQVSNVFGWGLPNFASQESYNEWLIIHSFSITASPALRGARVQVSSGEGGAAPWASLQFIAGMHSKTNNDAPSHPPWLREDAGLPRREPTTQSQGEHASSTQNGHNLLSCETSVLSMTLPH